MQRLKEERISGKQNGRLKYVQEGGKQRNGKDENPGRNSEDRRTTRHRGELRWKQQGTFVDTGGNI